ncbi:hypothetical protein PACTADRAFT_50443 [Pachysolen tannophilus NRRL Y-2460]|uniref:Uncharacterized protein n=1 Tax=Pachysolen tannophilus NRRL Y-2460 TaxID=669874 RepID=A0A1E4TS48_PACTA|nr:hypothetical protein PACTADRAFT_50443 [Pachysolen tannophilus NRRL Y-2460]
MSLEAQAEDRKRRLADLKAKRVKNADADAEITVEVNDTLKNYTHDDDDDDVVVPFTKKSKILSRNFNYNTNEPINTLQFIENRDNNDIDERIDKENFIIGKNGETVEVLAEAMQDEILSKFEKKSRQSFAVLDNENNENNENDDNDDNLKIKDLKPQKNDWDLKEKLMPQAIKLDKLTQKNINKMVKERAIKIEKQQIEKNLKN